jgi:hypothetical protein
VIGQQLFDLTDALDAKIPQEYLNETNASNIAPTTRMSGFGSAFPLYWTENVTHDPSVSAITDGVRALWYPAQPKYNNAQGGPLWLGPDWTPVVFATSTTSTVAHNLATTSYTPLPPKNQIFQRLTPVAAPPLMGVRTYEKARVALFNQWHQFTWGSGTRWLYDSQVLSKGANGRPSDFGKLLTNTLAWLAAPSLSSTQLGGYVMPADKLQDPNSAAAVVEAYKEFHSSYTNKQLADGPGPDGKKMFRGLIGARSSLSSGRNTVAEIAAAARSSGLDFVVMLEDYCYLANASAGINATVSALVEECKTASDSELMIFPGFSLMNNLGESMMVWGHGDSIEIPSPKALVLGPRGCPVLDLQPTSQTNASRYTGYMGGGAATTYMFQQSEIRGYQVGFYHLGPSRPGAPATRTAKSLKMYASLAVVLYRDNELVEDITEDYLLHTQSTMTGIPVAVNLVHSAQGVIDAVATGSKQSLTHVRAVSLTEIYPIGGLQGDGSSAECGLRWNSQYDSSSVFVSNGPLVTAWASTLHVAALGAERFVTGRALMPSGLTVHSAAPLKQISIYNGQTLFRRIVFREKTAYNYSHTLLLEGWVQRNLVVIAEDTSGGKAGRRLLFAYCAEACSVSGGTDSVFCARSDISTQSSQVRYAPCAILLGSRERLPQRRRCAPGTWANDSTIRLGHLASRVDRRLHLGWRPTCAATDPDLPDRWGKPGKSRSHHERRLLGDHFEHGYHATIGNGRRRRGRRGGEQDAAVLRADRPSRQRVAHSRA